MAGFIGVGVGIGIRVEILKTDPDSDPDPDFWIEALNQTIRYSQALSECKIGMRSKHINQIEQAGRQRTIHWESLCRLRP